MAERNAAVIAYLCPDTDEPAGGIRVIYRHVDLLNKAGLRATVLHGERGFRCTWFENETRVSYLGDVPLREAVVTIPEVFGRQSIKLLPGLRKVIFNQGAYNTFVGHPIDLADRETPYLRREVEAAIVVSQDSADYLRHAFPRLPVYRTVNAIDPAIFHPAGVRRRRVAFMPRRNLKDATQVINILKFRGALDGVELVPIAGLDERGVADVLRDALIFLTFGAAEGCPTPPKEAMASGCLTIGYDGRGGREFLAPDVGYPVPTGDVLAFARTVEAVLAEYPQALTPLPGKARAAAAMICERYSPERERATVLDCWERILSPARPQPEPQDSLDQG